MSSAENTTEVFSALKQILLPYAEGLVCVHDKPDNFYLDTSHIMKNKKPMFFGAVQVRKRYVSFHLMPVYVFPELLEGVSADLKARMQGKSCFNFKQCDQALFDELSALTRQGYQLYKGAGYVD